LTKHHINVDKKLNHSAKEAIMREISEQDVAEYWNGNAPVWIDQVGKGFDVYREELNNPAIFEFMGDVRGKSVLDAGCGEGRNTRLLAKRGADVCGVDLTEAMIERAREEEVEAKLGIRYFKGSYCRMPFFQDSQFDLVVSFMALMDGPDYQGAVNEIRRVLKPNGELVFSISHPCFMTSGYGWVVDQDGKKARLTVAGYFNKEPYIEHWKFSHSPNTDCLPEFAIPRFPRTLSEYVNPLIEAGFSLVRLKEPRPGEEICKKYPSFLGWRDIAAIFLHVKARKL
jgi:ubiquinone/menaquinone biosynthesis C-methylase UbiE